MNDDLPSGWITELVSELDDLNSVFTRALDAARSADADEQDHVAPALAAVQGLAYLVVHLRKLPELADGKKTEYLQTIAMDLKNVADGMPTQFIKPYVLKNSSSVSHQAIYIQAEVVLVINVMVEAGYIRAEALRLISVELNRIGLPTPRRSNKQGWATSTLASWHVNSKDATSTEPWIVWVREKMAKLKADPNWPPSKTEALRYLGDLDGRINQKISISPRPMR
jgi:hypothetical protein